MNRPSYEPLVYLVGAGPGDPGLITVRGAELLERADVVVYDYLSNPVLLSYCPRAEIIFVGKKAADHSMSQEQINDLLIEKARSGKRVVRLKGGDPFVFGRGAEEAVALAKAGILFEVVPGITAAIAAPAYAGIPVTHRDLNSSFTLITGHEKEVEYLDEQAKGRSNEAGDIPWDAIAKLPCVAFYMGVKSLPRICKALMEHGMSPEMAAATIRWGTMPAQRTVVSTLSKLAEDVEAAGLKPPAMTIIGKVVELRESLNWFEQRPLFGQTIVVTRTRQQASELTRKLQALGASTIEAPTIELLPPANLGEIRANLNRAHEFDWVCFTSANGVAVTRQMLKQMGNDARAFGAARIAAIGDATRGAIERDLCLKVEVCPEQFVAEALADELISRKEVAGRRFMLLRADIARPLLRERLLAGGAAEVVDVPVYETVSVPSLPADLLEALKGRLVQWITFTSSSTARNFFELLGSGAAEAMADVKIASIGPITSKTIRECIFEPTVEARTFTIAGLVEAILESVGAVPKG
jgi:uroporphyrinogen III methyltransferase / synthase